MYEICGVIRLLITQVHTALHLLTSHTYDLELCLGGKQFAGAGSADCRQKQLGYSDRCQRSSKEPKAMEPSGGREATLSLRDQA